MKNFSRLGRIAGILTLCIVLSGCGLLDSIKSGWAASRPFIQLAVDQHIITQERADGAKRDVDEGIAAGNTAERCVSDIPDSVTGNERKVRKAHCYFTLAQTFRAILARHNLGGSADLDRYVAFAEGAILALEEYFNSVMGNSNNISVAATSGPPVDVDKKLEADIKQKLKALKAGN